MSTTPPDSLVQAIRSAGLDDLLALIPHFSAALKAHGMEYWWMRPEVFAAFEENGLHVCADHFYSCQPSLKDLAQKPWSAYDLPLAGVGFAPEGQESVVRAAVARAGEFQAAMAATPFTWANPFFPNMDALVYFAQLRDRPPANVIEIGIGYSTLVASQALKANGGARLTCIDPYPNPVVAGFADEIVASKVQDVDPAVFDRLGTGDVLFVDSSHTSKVGSDCHDIMFKILPRLPVGVRVHLHDIFLPRAYPREWVMDRNWFWNEQYLVQAFLTLNPSFRVMLLNNDYVTKNSPVLEKDLAFLECGPLSGASLWIERVA